MRSMTWYKAALLGLLIAAFGIPPQTFTALARQQGPQSQAPSQSEPPPSPSGKQPAPKTPQTAPETAISVQSNVVNIDAVVTDQDGNIVTGLKKQNFKVTDSGTEQQVTNFAPTDAPIMIVMLVEYSAEAYGYFGYKDAVWADQFLRNLKPQDWVALKTFDLRTTLQVDFTHNAGEVDQAIRTLGFPFFHEAALFDALFSTIGELRGQPGKKSILLITRGFDTISKHRLDETYNLMKETDVTIFAVGTGEEYDLYSNGNIGYLQAKNQLNTFAQMTGGYAWFPRFSGEIPGIFNSVAAFLRNQYTIGFSPTTPQDGKYHKVVVSIVDDDGNPMMLNDKKGKKHKVVVISRPGYTAPKPTDIPPGN
ncbi:MAG TPA: VWA domain-containing protein [Candidatus Acidoferrum sp.]|jgi:VWFA-related protein|nr:VWA domain-containing protein [Candidatus Acidoferrum sp.]